MSQLLWPEFRLLLGGCQCLLSVWFLFQFLGYRPSRFPKWLAYGVSAGALMAFHLMLTGRIAFFWVLLGDGVLLLGSAFLWLRGSGAEKVTAFLAPLCSFPLVEYLLTGQLDLLTGQVSPSRLAFWESRLTGNSFPLAGQVPILRFHTPIPPTQRYWPALLAWLVILALLLTLYFGLLSKQSPRESREWILRAAVFSLACMVLWALCQLFTSLSHGNSSLFQQCLLVLSLIGTVAVGYFTFLIPLWLNKKHQLELENLLLKQNTLLQEKSAKELQAHYRQLQAMRHDFKHNLTLLQALNRQGEREQIDRYIQDYLKTQETTQKFVSTQNLALNAILNQQLSNAYQAGVNVKLQIPPQVYGVGDGDLCSLLGNLMENAIEASQTCDRQREIRLELTSTPEEFSLTVKNTVPRPVLEENPNLVSSKPEPGHGLGTKIIRDLAKRYHGFTDYYQEGDFFCCHVLLYPNRKHHS